jgi:hypothetical protein
MKITVTVNVSDEERKAIADRFDFAGTKTKPATRAKCALFLGSRLNEVLSETLREYEKIQEELSDRPDGDRQEKTLDGNMPSVVKSGSEVG